MITLGVILARAGSKGLPNKCMRDLLGQPVIQYTFNHVAQSKKLTAALITTDSKPAQVLAQKAGLFVVERPVDLATDLAPVDEAARHAVECWEKQNHQTVTMVALLYGNIPVRAAGLIDRAIDQLVETGADSVRSVAPVSKQHPDWVHRLKGDRMIQFRPNSIYRRQDLERLYYHDGAIAVVKRKPLFDARSTPEDRQSFLGSDRRALVQRPEDTVDIDEPIDLLIAKALLEAQTISPPVGV